MKEGTIFYNGIDLGSLGTLQMTTRTTPDPPAPEIPSQMVTTFSITITPSAAMPSTVQRRIAELQEMMKASEGLLRITNEHGVAKEWLARVTNGNNPQSTEPTSGEFTLDLTSTLPLNSPNGPDASFAPEDESPPVLLHSARTISETVSSERPGQLIANRTQTTETVTFSARSYAPNPSADTATRLVALQVIRESLANLNAKIGILTIGAEARPGMMIQSITPKISPDQTYLEIDVQATRKILPGSSTTETRYTCTVADAAADGTITTTYTGTISAPVAADATTKMSSLQTTWTTGTRKLIQRSVNEAYLEGEDSDGGASWDGLNFTLVFEEPPPNTSWSLKVASKRGSGGATTTYSGNVKAPSELDAIAKIVALAGGKHPVLIQSETTLNSRNELGSGGLPGEFVSMDFNYSYSTVNIIPIALDLTESTTRPTNGEHTTSLSGSISAPTMAEAESIANSFIPGGAILTENSRTERRHEATDTGAIGLAANHVSMSFSLSWRVQHTTTSATWNENHSTDYTSMLNTISVSGTVWSSSELAATLAISGIMSEFTTPTTPVKKLSVSPRKETPGTPPTNAFTVSTNFSFEIEQPIGGTIGHDLIEASWSLKRVGQVDATVITALPCADPIAQTGFGLTVGSLTASGKAKARTQQTATQWGQYKKLASASISGATGHALPPTETVQPAYPQFQGTGPVLFEFSFSYPYRYVDGLTGLWGSGMVVT